jgi:hypothetical protein
VDANLIRKVWQRAQSRCEYCHLPAAFHPAPFQVDHIIARQHRGVTSLDNLALACIRCNRFKGPNIAGLAPYSTEPVRPFHPRRDNWTDHFFWNGPRLEARTPIGRTTIELLRINDSEVIAVRQALQEEGVFGA